MLGVLAEDALREGRVDDAASLLRDSLALHSRLGDVLDAAVDLCRFAAALAAGGGAATAATLLASFDALGDDVGARRSSVADLNRQTLARIHAVLDDAAFSAAWARGLTLTLYEAVATALEA